MKNSRAAISRSPVWPRQTIVALPAMRTAGQSEAGSAWATEPPIVPQLRTCGSPIVAGDVVQERIPVADDLGLVDLVVGRPGTDAQVVVRLDDGVEAGHVTQVDEQGRLREAELDQRQEAVAPGEELRLSLAVLQDLERLVQVPRANVVELAWNHRAWTLPPRHGRGQDRPIQPRTGQSGGDDHGPRSGRVPPRPQVRESGDRVPCKYPSGVVRASTVSTRPGPHRATRAFSACAGVSGRSAAPPSR